jgi:prepilin-type N-terminal cleavage/methylation domain-containing protein
MPWCARTTSSDIACQAPALRGGASAMRAGFSIVELLIVIVIVGIMAMTVAPSLSEILSGNRHANAAMDLIKFARATRSSAVSSGAAQLMRYVVAGSNNLGAIERYVGLTNRCLQSRWDIAMGGDAGQGAKRALGFDMAAYNPGYKPSADDKGQQIIKMTAKSLGNTPKDIATELWLCYQPDGQVYAMYDSGNLQVQNIDVEFTISRSIQGEKHGVDRKVLFPSGGNARFE